MKKTIIILLLTIFISVLAFFAYKFFLNSPQVSDLGKHAWLERCANDSECKAGVEQHYLVCANSVSFEKPKEKSDMAEYISLTRIEMESCLSDKIGSDFPIN